MRIFARKFLADCSGATAVEYALIAGLITLALVSGMGLVREGLVSAFDSVANAMPKA